MPSPPIVGSKHENNVMTNLDQFNSLTTYYVGPDYYLDGRPCSGSIPGAGHYLGM